MNDELGVTFHIVVVVAQATVFFGCIFLLCRIGYRRLWRGW